MRSPYSFSKSTEDQCYITHFIKLGSPRQTLPWLCPANPMLEFANPESWLTPHILCIIHHPHSHHSNTMTNSPSLMIRPQFIRHPNKNEWTPANVAVRFIFLMPVSWQQEEQCSAGEPTTVAKSWRHNNCNKNKSSPFLSQSEYIY